MKDRILIGLLVLVSIAANSILIAAPRYSNYQKISGGSRFVDVTHATIFKQNNIDPDTPQELMMQATVTDEEDTDSTFTKRTKIFYNKEFLRSYCTTFISKISLLHRDLKITSFSIPTFLIFGQLKI